MSELYNKSKKDILTLFNDTINLIHERESLIESGNGLDYENDSDILCCLDTDYNLNNSLNVILKFGEKEKAEEFVVDVLKQYGNYENMLKVIDGGKSYEKLEHLYISVHNNMSSELKKGIKNKAVSLLRGFEEPNKDKYLLDQLENIKVNKHLRKFDDRKKGDAARYVLEQVNSKEDFTL